MNGIDERPELTPALRATLDGLQFAVLISRLGPPERVTTRWSEGHGCWRKGDGRPAIVLGPADGQAAGRCVASRVRHASMAGIAVDELHRMRCDWCDYPTGELLRALDHAAFMSRCVESEIAWWSFRADAWYLRTTGRAGQYDSPIWAAFWSLPTQERERKIAVGGGGSEVAGGGSAVPLPGHLAGHPGSAR